MFIFAGSSMDTHKQNSIKWGGLFYSSLKTGHRLPHSVNVFHDILVSIPIV
ncbi:hypothetical protein LINPERPRIM_LOCUS29269, partial [Linum perenne]